MYIPSITIEIDLEKESNMFINFLHNEHFPQNKLNIFRCYPALKEMLDKDTENENEIVHTFIENKYSEYNSIIQSTVSEASVKIDAYGKIVLEQLALLMDYTWSGNHPGYLIVPTILPFSPFKENCIYFSMIRKIQKIEKKDDMNHGILPFLAHEISHLILRDMLGENQKNGVIHSYDWNTAHLLQEILAPVLMNQEPLKDILDIKNYGGNPNLLHLNVRQNDQIENIVSYYEKQYARMKYFEKKPFIEIAKTMANELQYIHTELTKKMEMWNAHGHSLYVDNTLLSEYQSPILIAGK